VKVSILLEGLIQKKIRFILSPHKEIRITDFFFQRKKYQALVTEIPSLRLKNYEICGRFLTSLGYE
jgi:hypothetical protein